MKDQDDAEKEIKRFFPYAKTSEFIKGVGRSISGGIEKVFLKLKRAKAHEYILLPNGEFSEELPKGLKESLGPRAEEVVEANDGEISKRKGLLTKKKEN